MVLKDSQKKHQHCVGPWTHFFKGESRSPPDSRCKAGPPFRLGRAFVRRCRAARSWPSGGVGTRGADAQRVFWSVVGGCWGELGLGVGGVLGGCWGVLGGGGVRGRWGVEEVGLGTFISQFLTCAKRIDLLTFWSPLFGPF